MSKKTKKKIKKAKKSAKKPVKRKPVKKAAKKVAKKVAPKKKKSVRLAPKRAKAKEGVISESAVLGLIEKGRHRGFVTQAEVLNTFPNIEKDIKGLEALYERLEGANINIIESGRVFEEEKNKEYEEKKKIEVEFGDASSDSVQMYLKEIGQYALLTGDEEVELAKRIERNDESARQKDYRIESIRLLVSRSQLSTLDSKKKVFIIDGAEDLSPAAANALLKSLEEASKHAVWILLSQSSERMLPTVLSRCRKVNFAEGQAERLEIDEDAFSKLPGSAFSWSAQVLAAGKKVGGRKAAEQFLKALSLRISEDLHRNPTPERADSLLAVLSAQQDLARNVSPQAVLDLALLSVKP